MSDDPRPPAPDGTRPHPPAPVRYVCGHGPREIERLALQARIYEAVTRRLLSRAGIGAGFHVVDLGCGGGDVSLLAAEAVGPTGSVLGVDRSADAVAAATARAREAGHAHARFIVAELDAWAPATPVDAVVGRFVLMHQRDPVALVARARRWVRPGGVVAFVESDNAWCQPGRHSRPHSPTYHRIVRSWQGILGAAGAHLDMGSRLGEGFVAAGLPDPSEEVDVPTTGDPASPIFRFAVESLRSMLPLAAASGVPVPAAAEADSLEAALRAEVAALDGTLSAPPAHAVWARVRG
ncbi:MAG: methyltransferase domain-containing protein [Acidobacteria bacterium]|nr:methyltransferase domain-containing protein [Acidobacteriota bacterium]